MNHRHRAVQVYTGVFVILLINALRTTYDACTQILFGIQSWQQWLNTGQGVYGHPTLPGSLIFTWLVSALVSWALAVFVWTVRTEAACRMNQHNVQT